MFISHLAKLPAQIEILGRLVPPRGRLSKKVKFTTQEAIESIFILAKVSLISIITISHTIGNIVSAEVGLNFKKSFHNGFLHHIIYCKPLCVDRSISLSPFTFMYRDIA